MLSALSKKSSLFRALWRCREERVHVGSLDYSAWRLALDPDIGGIRYILKINCHPRQRAECVAVTPSESLRLCSVNQDTNGSTPKTRFLARGTLCSFG